MQAADLFFGADALPHDYLHEALFRLLAIGYIASGTSFLVNKVRTTSILCPLSQQALACANLMYTSVVPADECLTPAPGSSPYTCPLVTACLTHTLHTHDMMRTGQC